MPNGWRALGVTKLLFRDFPSAPTSSARLPPCPRTQAAGRAPPTDLDQLFCPLLVMASSFITVAADCTVKGFLIYYPLQPCADSDPIPYPWSIDFIADNAAVQDIEILNPFNAVRAVLAGVLQRLPPPATTPRITRITHSFPSFCRPPLHRPHPRAAAPHRTLHRQHLRNRQ